MLLSIDEYHRLLAKADTRKAGRLKTMSDDLFEEMKEASALMNERTTRHKFSAGLAPASKAQSIPHPKDSHAAAEGPAGLPNL